MYVSKRSNGTYQVRVMVNGERRSRTLKYKPTAREVNLIVAELQGVPTEDMTVGEALVRYIEVKSNVLSPSTITNYKRYLKAYPSRLTGAFLSALKPSLVQSCINELAGAHSPKYVRNLYGLLTAAVKMYAPDYHFRVTLPKREHKEPYIPTTADVAAILNEAKGTPYEVPLILATFGLRRGEICALTMADIRDGEIRVNKALALSESGYVVKEPKTASSIRTVKVPREVTDLIKRQGLYKGEPCNIYRYLRKIQDELGIEHFSLHKLRHYFASQSHALGVPDAYIMSQGGWATAEVMQTVYRHTQSDISFDNILGQYFLNHVTSCSPKREVL